MSVLHIFSILMVTGRHPYVPLAPRLQSSSRLRAMKLWPSRTVTLSNCRGARGMGWDPPWLNGKRYRHRDPPWQQMHSNLHNYKTFATPQKEIWMFMFNYKSRFCTVAVLCSTNFGWSIWIPLGGNVPRSSLPIYDIADLKVHIYQKLQMPR